MLPPLLPKLRPLARPPRRVAPPTSATTVPSTSLRFCTSHATPTSWLSFSSRRRPEGPVPQQSGDEAVMTPFLALSRIFRRHSLHVLVLPTFRKVSIAAAATNGSGPKQMRTETDGQPIQPAAVTAATTTVKPAAPAARPVAGRVTIPKKPVAMASARDKMDPALAKKTDPAKRVKGAGTYKTPGQSRL